MSSKGITIITPGAVDPTRDVQVYADKATNALLVKIVNPGSGGGGGTEYAEDAAHTTGDFGTLSLVVRKDTPGSLVSADGDYAPLQVDSTGALRVVVVSGGGGGTQYAEDAAHTTGDTGTLALVVRNDTPGSLAGTDGDYAVLQVDATGRLRVAVDASTTVAVSQSGAWSVEATQATHASLNAQVRLQDKDSGGLLSVLQTGAAGVFPLDEYGILPLFEVTDSPAATGGTFTHGRMNEAGAIYVTVLNGATTPEGTTHSSGDSGVPAWGVRNDAGTAMAADQAYHPLMISGTGRLFVDVGTPTVAVSGTVTVSGTVAATQSGTWNIGTVTPGTGSTNLGKAEDAAHTTGDVGVMPLAVRSDSETSLSSATGDYTPLQVGATGRLKGQTIVESGDLSGLTLDVFESATLAVSSPHGIVPIFQGANDPLLPIEGDWAHPFMSSQTGGIIVHVINTLSNVNLDSSKLEDAAHTTGAAGQFVLAVRNDTPSALAGTNGDYIPFITDSSGRLHVTLGSQTVACTQSGTWNIGTVTPGSAATNLGKAEDAVHASGDVGVQVLAVRRDTLASSTSAAGDYATFSVDSVGALWTREAGLATIALSGSTRGRPIQITGTSSGAANTLHTATTTAGQLDRVYIDLTNTSGSAVLVTIEFGTTGTANELHVTVPPRETVKALEGLVLGGAATDTIKAYAATGSVINAVGRVERLS